MSTPIAVPVVTGALSSESAVSAVPVLTDFCVFLCPLLLQYYLLLDFVVSLSTADCSTSCH